MNNIVLNGRSTVKELKELGELMGLPLYFTMRDDIEHIPKNVKNVIINLSDDPKNGTHWVCCRILKDKILYFDSFGLIYPLELEGYAKKNNKKIIHNIKQIQNINHGYCGAYCLLALYCMKHNKDLEKDFGLKPIRSFPPI